eukprot:40932_1
MSEFRLGRIVSNPIHNGCWLYAESTDQCYRVTLIDRQHYSIGDHVLFKAQDYHQRNLHQFKAYNLVPIKLLNLQQVQDEYLSADHKNILTKDKFLLNKLVNL